jgi:hypothetical protein
MICYYFYSYQRLLHGRFGPVFFKNLSECPPAESSAQTGAERSGKPAF